LLSFIHFNPPQGHNPNADLQHLYKQHQGIPITRYISSLKASNKETMKSTTHLSSLLLLSLLGFSLGSDSTSPLQDTCSKEFEKLTMCLDYATAKVAQPGSTCCTAVSGIRKDEPACLCYIIQQAHSSSSSMVSMGIKFDRLLSLPDSCKLANSSVSDCPSKTCSLPLFRSRFL
jgi:Probable lipid transfer